MTKSWYSDLSTTAINNSTIDGNNVAENCAMSGMNNAVRGLGAMIAGALETVATATADSGLTYTATLAPVPDGLTTGMEVHLTFGTANSSTTPTLNLNGLGAKGIVLGNGNAVAIGSLNGNHILSYDGSTNFRVLNPIPIGANPSASVGYAAVNGSATTFMRSDAAPALGALTTISNSLGSDVLLNNIASFFDGPSCAQGTSGTWFASGTVTVQDTLGVANISAKLWDGTTQIATAITTVPAVNSLITMHLSGVISSPAGNIRISCKDGSSTSGKILFGGANASNLGADSTLTVVRIG